MSWPAIVLAGGLGTRLRSITKNRCPKPMVPVELSSGSYPFVEFVLRHLYDSGICEITICLGHLGNQIPRYFGDGSAFGLSINYNDAGKVMTANRVLSAAARLDAPEFLVVCGDTYHPIHYGQFMSRFHRRSDWLAQLAVHERAAGEPANVRIANDGRVTAYSADAVTSGLNGLETGTLALRRNALDLFRADTIESLNEHIYPRLISRRALGALASTAPFFDIGTVAGYEAFCAYARDGGAAPLSRLR